MPQIFNAIPYCKGSLLGFLSIANQITGTDGKPVYDRLIEFRSKAIADKFRDQIIEAIKRDCPNLLTGVAESVQSALTAHEGRPREQRRTSPSTRSRSTRSLYSAPRQSGRSVPDLSADRVDDLWAEGGVP